MSTASELPDAESAAEPSSRRGRDPHPVRDVALPGGAGTLALITLDNGFDHTKPNTFGPRPIAGARPTVDRRGRAPSRRDRRRRASPASRSSSPSAPTSPACRPAAADQAPARSRRARPRGLPQAAQDLRDADVRLRQRCRDGRRPRGRRCTATYRTVMRPACPRSRLPEVLLGLVPGWGGACLLPNLVGADKAVTVIVENPLNQNQHAQGRGGLRRSAWPTPASSRADFLEQSLLWAAGVLDRRGHRRAPRGRPRRGRGTPPSRAAERTRRRQDRRRQPRRRVRRARPDRGRPRLRPATRASPPRTTRSPTCSWATSCAPASTRSTWCRSAPSGPPAHPTRSLARPVTKVGIVGAGLMASQLALLFVRRLEVPVVLTDLDQERVDKGVGYVHAEIDKLARQGPAQPGQGQPLQGPGHRARSTRRRLRRRRLRHRGGLRGDGGQEAGLRRGRGRRLARVRARDQHLVAVDHRDGRRSSSTPSGSSASTSSTRSRSCRCSRSSRASRPTTPRWPRRSPSARR